MKKPIELVYTANELSQDSQMHIEVNQKKFRHKITEDGEWYKPKTVEIGKIFISKDQNCRIKITAGHSLSHTIANLMEIKLVPVN